VELTVQEKIREKCQKGYSALGLLGDEVAINWFPIVVIAFSSSCNKVC
jgi:hypothetical protein